MKIAVVGASGFLGSKVALALRQEGHEVVAVRAPRLDASQEPGGDLEMRALVEMRDQLVNVEALVNCAGIPDASEQDLALLLAANASSPAVVARASKMAGVTRLVHVSSAVVQGRRAYLDESDSTEEFSAYSLSKAEGERRVRQEFNRAVIYRPPSVHAEGRRVTALTSRVARSPIASVASPGSQRSPQALVENVASAIVFLATTANEPPAVVIHPWEGLTAIDVMTLLGGKRPILIPRWLARAVCAGMEAIGRKVPGVAANARRLEMLWFGQEQAESWLTEAGWRPALGFDSWRELGRSMRSAGTHSDVAARRSGGGR